MCHPSILINGHHEQLLIDSDDYNQAIKELLATGLIKDLGINLSRHQYGLSKTRSSNLRLQCLFVFQI
jgi:predicted oxidoreductase